MEEVGVILPLVQTIQRVTCFINHLLFTMLHLEEQSHAKGAIFIACFSGHK